MRNRVVGGVVGGLVGGLAFGVMMQMMGMIGMVAGLVGGSGAGAGWIVHLAIAAVIGFGYGLLSTVVAPRLAPNLGLGVAYGLVWWILGPLLIMPAVMGMSLFTINQGTLMSLVGHLLYGAITGVVAALVVQRLGASVAQPTEERV